MLMSRGRAFRSIQRKGKTMLDTEQIKRNPWNIETGHACPHCNATMYTTGEEYSGWYMARCPQCLTITDHRAA